MKGIILAGGAGTRLYPITKALSKQMLPIYDKPMIYYPLAILMQMGIRDILIISTPRDIEPFKQLLGDGQQWGIHLHYAIQENPKGIADAFRVGESFIGDDKVTLILGDNVFYGHELEATLQRAVEEVGEATIFGYYVEHPQAFGVVSFDASGKAVSIEEKPHHPKSHYAVPGLYVYDNSVVEVAKTIKPSPRGELEITAVNEVYLQKNTLKVEVLGKGVVWLDTGTNENLLRAANYIEAIQNVEGIYIACPEEIAYKKGFIGEEAMKVLIQGTTQPNYRAYLERCLKEGRQ